MVPLQEFEPLKPAEGILLDAALKGEQCSFGGARPSSATEANEVRADFLRFLALGGENRRAVHESGIRIQGAFISGAINLDGATRVRPLWIENSTIGGEFHFSDAETKIVSLCGTAVSGIRGDSVIVDGSLLLRGTVIDGSLRLFGAEITGTLSCAGCTIGGKPWKTQRLAADLETVTIGGNLELREDFRANGLILLDNAEIGGTFDCTGGQFFAGFNETHPGDASRWDPAIRRTMKCHRLNLKGSLYLRDCGCDGEASFSGAQIGGDIDCRNGQFKSAGNGDSTALRFTRVDAGGNVYLSAGFEAKGKVQVNGAIVRGNIDCRGGSFSVPHSISHDAAAPGQAFSEDALSLVNATVSGALILASMEGKNESPAVFNGSLDLKSARIHVLVDSPQAWPEPKHSNGLCNVIHLDGFTFERFGGGAPVEASIRKNWLKRQPPAHLGRDFKPQPFEQLIKVLRDMGHPEEAQRLAMERQGYLVRRRLARWAAGPRGALDALGALLWAMTGGLLIGHGYRPLRVLFIMAAVGLACGFYFKLAAEQGVFAPRDSQVFLAEQFKDCRPEAHGNWTQCVSIAGQKFAEYPQFDPWIYSFNVLLPVVDLQQEKSWVPMQKEVNFTVGGRTVTVPGWGTNALVLAELMFGWVASLLAIATFSGLVKTE
ncbi:MAG: hypothetical protein ACLPX9_09645 [Rhodomicrobium sp.]